MMMGLVQSTIVGQKQEVVVNATKKKRKREERTADAWKAGRTRDDSRDVLADDRLAEDGAAEDVTDRTVGRLPHLLQVVLCVGVRGRAQVAK